MSFASFQTAFACLGKGCWVGGRGWVGDGPPCLAQPTPGLSISSPFLAPFCKGMAAGTLFLFSLNAICPSVGRTTLNTKWSGIKKRRGGGNNDSFWLKPKYFDSRSCHSISCNQLSVSSSPSLHIPGPPCCASSPAQPGSPRLGEGCPSHRWVEDIKGVRNPHPTMGRRCFKASPPHGR